MSQWVRNKIRLLYNSFWNKKWTVEFAYNMWYSITLWRYTTYSFQKSDNRYFSLHVQILQTYLFLILFDWNIFADVLVLVNIFPTEKIIQSINHIQAILWENVSWWPRYHQVTIGQWLPFFNFRWFVIQCSFHLLSSKDS